MRSRPTPTATSLSQQLPKDVVSGQLLIRCRPLLPESAERCEIRFVGEEAFDVRFDRIAEAALLPVLAETEDDGYERVLTLGIERTPEELSRRIRERAEAMFPAMLEEVSRLVPSRFSGAEPGFRCLGYPEALACLRGELSAQQGLEGMIRSTLAYAKRQRTWFRHQAQVRWLDPAVDPARLAAELA